MDDRKLSEMDIFREVLMVASTRGNENCDATEDKLTFLNIVDSFDTVVTATGIDKELQAACYQAILLMSSDSTKHWTDKLTAPGPYMQKRHQKAKNSSSTFSTGTTVYLRSDQEKSNSTSDDLARLNQFMSRSLLHSRGYGSPVKAATMPVPSPSSNHPAYSPLNNYFEAKEGAQIAPSFSQSRMRLNHHYHTPVKEEYEGTINEVDIPKIDDSHEYIRTYQGRSAILIDLKVRPLRSFLMA